MTRRRPSPSRSLRTYGELTGSPGLALATRGPGAVSAANGSAHALLDRALVVIVTDAIAHADRPRVTHQLVDHAAVFRATAKASIEIGASPYDAAQHAVALALQPPWGPVHLDVVADAPPPAASSLDPSTPNPSPTTLPAVELIGDALVEIEAIAYCHRHSSPRLSTAASQGGTLNLLPKKILG